MSTQAAIRPALPAISVMVSRPTSGRPISAAEVPNPVMYTAGNPASSTSRADSGSNAPGATMVWPDSSSARSRAGPPGRGVSRAVTRGPSPLHSKAWRAATARGRGSGGAFGDEHELAAGAVRGFPDVQHPVALGGQTRLDLGAAAEPQRGVRGDHLAVGQEGIGVAERDERQVHGGDLAALLDRSGARQDEGDRAGIGRPLLPGPAFGAPG